jgi:hypothetical protein
MSGFGNIFKDIGSFAVKAFDDVKLALTKAANEAPVIEAAIQKDAPEIEALAKVVAPSLAGFSPGIISLGEEVLSVLEQGGAAAEANFLNSGMDQSVLDAAKALLPAAKALVTKKTS